MRKRGRVKNGEKHEARRRKIRKMKVLEGETDRGKKTKLKNGEDKVKEKDKWVKSKQWIAHDKKLKLDY